MRRGVGKREWHKGQAARDLVLARRYHAQGVSTAAGPDLKAHALMGLKSVRGLFHENLSFFGSLPNSLSRGDGEKKSS